MVSVSDVGVGVVVQDMVREVIWVQVGNAPVSAVHQITRSICNNYSLYGFAGGGGEFDCWSNKCLLFVQVVVLYVQH